MASQRLPTVCLYLTVCFQTHIFDRPVQSETSPGCVEAYAYHAQGGKGHTWCWCSSEGNLYNTHNLQFHLGSVSCCWEMVECVAFGYFFDFQKKRKTENWHQNRRYPLILWMVVSTLWPFCNPKNSGRFYIVANEKDEKADTTTGVGWYGHRLVFRWIRGWVERHLTHFCQVVYIVDEQYDPVFKRNFDGTSTILQLVLRSVYISNEWPCRWEKTSNQFFQHKHPCSSEMVFGGRSCGWTNKHVYVDLYLFFIYWLMASKMFEFSLLKTHLMYSKTIDLHVIHIPIFWVNESSTCFWSHRFQACTTSVFWNCGFCLEPGRR